MRLEITALLALGALAHRIAELGGRILLLQLTVHLHDLLVPFRGALRHLAGLTLAAFGGINGRRDVRSGGNVGNIDGGGGNVGSIGTASFTTGAALTTHVFGHLYV